MFTSERFGFAARTGLVFLTLFSLCARGVDCPAKANLGALLSERRATLGETKAGLERIFRGDTSKHLIPESLFTVELTNSEAVGARVRELKGLVDGEAKPYAEKYGRCTPSGSDLAKELVAVDSLEREVNRLRLDFLSLPEERRAALLSTYRQANDQQASLQALAAEKLEAEKRSAEAAEALRKAEAEAQRAASEDLRELAAARALFEKRRQDLAELSVKWTQELEATTAKAGQFSEELSRDASVLSRRDQVSTEKVGEGYRAVTQTWRELVDLLFSRLGGKPEVRAVPEALTLPAALVARVKDASKEVEALQQVFAQMDGEVKQLVALREKIAKEENEMLYRLLLTSGKLRAQFIEELSRRGETVQFSLDNDYLADQFREIRLIPYRPVVLIRSVALETAEQLGNGVTGILALLNRLFVLLLFLVLPTGAFFLLKRASRRLDDLRAWLIRSRGRFRRASFLALWIRRLNPYLPWATMLVASKLARLVVEGTYLEGVAEVLPYFEYFVVYRVFRLALSEAALSSNIYSPGRRSDALGPKIEKTGRYIGIFFLVAACLLQATETIARKALFYHLIWDLLVYITPVWLATAAHWWKEELAEGARELLPDGVGSRLSGGCLSRWGWFVSLPTAATLFLVTVSKRLFSELAQLDSAKRVSAQLFRRKLESAAKGKQGGAEKQRPGPDYLSYFELGIPSDVSLLVSPESSPQKSIYEAIESWRSGKTAEHTLAIQGEKGVGKSCLLQLIENHFPDLEVSHVSVPEKITDEGALEDFLRETLQVTLAEPKSGQGATASDARKRLVLLDEGQNLFLARRGGFAAFRAFIGLCNRPDASVFWCVAINRYAWAYLNAVTGGSQYFRHVFELEGWSDGDIRTLILGRHEKTGYRLEFDPIIFAMEAHRGGEELKLVQDRYFELLWDQSRGNPRTALILWLSALELVGDKRVRVGLPATSPSKPLAGLTDDELFVIAAVIRHENLTTREAQSVTSLSEGLVRHAFRMGLERGFLDRSESGRYRIRPLWQAPLTQTLINKNFVHG